jgi:pimeloyl-ACP methyl ester carboxylesterase
MWIYELAAWAIMPRKRHKKSRILFIKEAKKLCQKEFIRWFKLIKEVDIVHKKTQHNKRDIPKLYIMGEEDYMFLPPVEKIVKNNQTASLAVIKRAGHVCNVDMPVEFNEVSLSFLKEKTKKQPSATY